MRSIIHVSLLLLLSSAGNAQGVGIGTATPQAKLDITSTTEGLLIPRVSLTSTLVVLPVLTGTTSELVYNTATAGDVTPGFYYLSTATGPWVRLGGATGWLTTGNSGIVNGTNYMGTDAATNIDVEFRRNNLHAGRIGSTSTNFGLGSAAVNTATGTTAFGVNALNSNSSGVYNTAIGHHASRLTTTGIYSTALGAFANELSSGVNYNTAVGAQSLQAANGGNNTAVGLNALQDNTASGNTAVGHLTLANNTSGTGNVAMGFQALDANLTGANNTAVGYNASGALNASNVTTFGYNAGAALTAQDNTAIGSGAMDGLTSTASRENTAVGYEALSAATGSTVSSNTAVGHQAASGVQSIDNTAVGRRALFQATSGQMNTAIGSGSMEQGNTSFNTAVGQRALFSATGNSNVAIGYQAAQFHNAGNGCVVIGYQAWAQGYTNSIAIGYQAAATQSNHIRMGNAAITLATTSASWTVVSDGRKKSNIMDSPLGLDFVKTLRPVSYYKNNDDQKKTEYGFIAQEVEIAFNKVGDTNNGVVHIDPDGNYGLRYNDLLPITVKAVQEQQQMIEELQKRNAELEKVNSEILKRLEALEKN